MLGQSVYIENQAGSRPDRTEMQERGAGRLYILSAPPRMSIAPTAQKPPMIRDDFQFVSTYAVQPNLLVVILPAVKTVQN